MYKVNLLPDYLQSSGFSSKKIRQLVYFLLFMLLLALYSGFLQVQSLALEGQLAEEKNELEKLQPKLSKIDSLKTATQAKQEQYLALSQITNNRLVWHQFLEDLPLALPADTWLVSIEINKMGKLPQNGGFVSSGFKQYPKNIEKKLESKETSILEQSSLPVPNVVYLTGSCWTMGSVGVLVDNLCLLPYFTAVELVEANLDRQKGSIKFEIVAIIKGGEWDVRQIPKP